MHCITVGGKLNINVCKLVMLMDSDLLLVMLQGKRNAHLHFVQKYGKVVG